MANTTLNLRVNAQFDELTQLNAEAQRSRDKIAAMEQASKILGKTVDTTDAAVEAHVRSLKTLQKNLDQNSKEYRQAQQELERYSKTVDDTTLKFKSFGESIDDLKQSFVSLVALETVIETFQAIADAAVQMFNNIADASLEVQNLANVLDTSAESVDRVRILFQRYGGDLRDYGDFTAELTEKLSDLSSELRAGGQLSEQTNKFQQVLKNLGVNALDAAGNVRNIQEVAIEFARGISSLSGSERVNYISAVMGSPAESARLLTVLERVGVEFDNQNAIINDDFVQRVREFRIEQEKLNEAFQRLIVDNSDAIIRFLQLMLQIMERLVPVIDTVIKTISLIPTEAFELGAIAAFAPSLLPNYITQKGFAKLTQKPATIYEDDLRFTPPGLTRPPAPQLQQQQQETEKNNAEEEAERAAQKRQQEAEKLARAITQYEREIGKLREGYERDIAKLRIDTLKQIQQMEADLQRQKRDAEMGLADAILRRDRAQQDRELYMRLRRGDITQQQFDIQTEANRFERENQDAVLTYQRERLEIQNRYAENVQKIADLEISHQQKLRELEQKRVDDMRNAAQRIADQGYTPTTPTTPTSPTTPTTSRPNARREVTIQSRGAVNPLLYLPRNAPGITVSPSAENVNWSQVGTRHGMLGGINRRPLPPNRQVDSTNGVPVSLAARGVSQVQQLFALAQGSNRFTPFNQATSQIDLANLETGLFSTSAFDQLRYGGFSGYAPFRNPSMFGQYGDISFAGLTPYPQQIMGVGLQTAQTNLQTSQFSSRFNYPSDLTNPQTGALATMEQEFELAMRRFQLEQQYGQITADRYLKAEEAARLESQTLEAANQKLQVEIESGNYQGQTLESLRSELTINNEKIGQLQQLPGLVLQTSQAQEQKLELVQMERQLQVDIANIISTNISQGIMNLITGSQSLGEVLNNVVMNVLNQMLQKFIEMVVQATILKGIMSAFGGGGGGLFGGLFSFLGFANGGIMTGDGALPLQRYARGGIARSPQLAMFGEGSKPEAYVPLPDGRSIPVTIKGFANGGIYDPVTAGVFPNPYYFLSWMRGMADTETSRRYQSDAQYRDTVDKLINEYIGVQYSAMMDDVQGTTNPYALEETLKKLREQQPDVFADEEFARFLLDQKAETFFNQQNIGYLRTAYGLGDDEASTWAARLQRQYIDRRVNQERLQQNYMSQLLGGVYDMNYEPIKNRFTPNGFQLIIQQMMGANAQLQQPALTQYASGGIARSPQLAMFGEGALPEAFVPLPDGRSIPVSLMGSGGGGNQTTNVNNISVNVSASGAMQQSDAEPQGDRLARAITRAVQEEIMRQQRPGGLLR